jgi:UDP-N-acetylmuramate--alanine ligase
MESSKVAEQLPHVHFIGIGGSGLSAIARLLLESGYTVTGSDRTLSPLARELIESGVRVALDHSAENVSGADIIVRSSAIPDDNVEVQAALASGIPVLKRAQFLGRLMQNHLGIAVAGTHGKTTTTAMIAWLLTSLGQDPSYIIGGTVKNLGGRNAHVGKGMAFVIEADEYDRMFLGLNPDVIVVCSLEHDHPDCFPTPQDYYQAFVEFSRRLQPGGMLLLSDDYPEARRLVTDAPKDAFVQTFGTGPAASYIAENLVVNARGGSDYDAFWHSSEGKKIHLAHISLQVPGEHNVRNSLAALAVIHRFVLFGDTPEVLDKAAHALAEFAGTGRRFDVLGEVDGVTVIDDYAHHPTKIQATLAAARSRYPGRRIWAVWQPHTFSRTRALLENFARSFELADQVIVSEIYAAREKAQDFDHFSSAQVLDGMTHPNVQLIPSLEGISAYLLQQLRPGDVLLVLSAGDADQVSAQVLSGLRERKGQND